MATAPDTAAPPTDETAPPAADLGEIADAVITAALDDGMSEDLKEITLTFGDDGSVTVKATPVEGVVYEASMDAEQVAAALDAEEVEDAGEEAAA